MLDETIDNSKILHIIYGSRTGNSRSAAELAHEYSKFLGLRSELVNMQEFEPENIRHFKNILIAVSTHGEGDPPLAAESLLANLSGASKPLLKNARFSVLALGDSSYRHFCKTGHDFRHQLLRLGAMEVFDIQECDIDFEEDAKKWIEGAVNAFLEFLPSKEIPGKKQFTFELLRPDEALGNAYMARVLEKRILNEGNPVRNVMHVSLSLKNSGIEYQPGDSIGVYSFNSRMLVDELIRLQGYDPTHVLESNNLKSMLKQVLVSDYELTLLTPVVLKKYAELTRNRELVELLGDEKKLQVYCLSRDVFDMVTDFPGRLTIEEFLSVLRKLPPRLYSVANSPRKDPEKVELMVGLVAFSQNKRNYEGVGSSFLSTRIDEGETVGIYLEENQKFRLPDPDEPIIMIGAGTGLAPFRAFLQDREESGAAGKNWLFFGDQYMDTDFFYRDELERYLEKGLLKRLDTAFSRDQRKKQYVTHRMLENGPELYRWIRDGAIVYLCGNKRKLAISARQALRRIFREEGGLSPQHASSYLKELKAGNQLREDVY